MRGKPLDTLTPDSLWGQGPTFLWCDPYKWPRTRQLQAMMMITDHNEELKKSPFCGLTTTTTNPLPNAKQFSTFRDLLPATSQSLHEVAPGNVTAYDYHEAQLSLLQQAQLDSFPVDYAHLQSGKPVARSSRLLSPALEFDPSNKLIRVGGLLR